jgi:hypothetical protein
MKIVIVIDEAQPAGVAANAAAVLAFSVSPLLEDCVGEDLRDRDGGTHRGITNIPLPVLSSAAAALAEIRAAAMATSGASCIDFSETARGSRNYADYARKMAAIGGEELRYVGLCVYGDDAAVRSLTGSLPLLGRRAAGD